jgi:signal peptidase I
MIFLGIFGVFASVSLLIAWLLTYIATRWMAAPGATAGRAAAVVLVVAVLQACIVAGLQLLPPSLANSLLYICGAFLLALLSPLLIYRIAYHAVGRQLLGFIGVQVLHAVVGVGMIWLMRLYASESFALTANSMAPTLYGPRLEAVCQKCGGQAVVTHNIEAREFGRRIGIEPQPCLQCGTLTRFDDSHEGLPADRFAVEKLSTPGRWDLVAFRVPDSPETIYVKRLVGLPGETITIRDGFVHANGQKQVPPSDAGKLWYTTNYAELGENSRDPLNPGPLKGDEANPIRLGDDEYFMLGDHTRRSLDSRYFGPIRRHAFIGVASVIYWPPERWRLLK